jgi:putative oxidoreductase
MIICKIGCKIHKFLNNIGQDVALLLTRISMIYIFFYSGLTKIRDWDSTLFLFEVEYALPIIPHEWAALSGTFFELAMPILILFGVMTRITALPLLVMAMTIQFYLGSVNSAYNQLEHYWWMILLLILITFGAGRLSADYYISRYICNKHCKRD